SQPKTENSRIVSKPYRFSANISAMAKIRFLRQQCRADLWPKVVRGFCSHDRFVRQVDVVPRSHQLCPELVDANFISPVSRITRHVVANVLHRTGPEVCRFWRTSAFSK